MQSVERIGENLDSLLKEFPARRRELHERIGAAVHRELQDRIDSSGLRDAGGRVKRWQIVAVGSGGGYAAVRAEKGATGANSPGAITNYLEGGHRIRPPSGRGAAYRSRIRVAYVNGFHFYAETSQRAESIAIAEAELWLDELADEFDRG